MCKVVPRPCACTVPAAYREKAEENRAGSRGRARLWVSLGEIPELRPAVPLAPRTLHNRAGTWWGGGTESEEIRRAAPLKQGGPELDVLVGSGWRRSVHRCGGCMARLGAAPRLPPVRCGTATAAGRSPQEAAAVPSPEGAAPGKGLSRGPLPPPPPPEPQDAGR